MASAITQALATYTTAEQLAVGEQLALKLAQRYQREATRAKQQKIVQALVQKGFSFDIAQTVVAQIDFANDEDTERANVIRQAERLWYRYRNVTESERQYKVKNKLYTKGFSAEWIDVALQTVTQSDALTEFSE